MAAVDKTYMNLDTYKQFRNFWIGTYDQQVEQLGEPIYMYSFQEFEYGQNITPDFLNQNKDDLNWFWKEGQERAILNTSTIEDAWLYQNCDFLDFSFMAGDNKFSTLMDFTEKESPYIVSIEYGDKSALYLWTDSSEESHIDLTDEFHVFGSTDFFKFWYTVKKIVCNIFYFDHLDINNSFEVEFFAYGQHIVAKKEKDTCKYYIDEKEIDFNVVIPKENFFFPKFQYHANLNDIYNYLPEITVLSMHNEFSGIDRYLDTSDPHRLAKNEFFNTFVEEIFK